MRGVRRVSASMFIINCIVAYKACRVASLGKFNDVAKVPVRGSGFPYAQEVFNSIMSKGYYTAICLD